MFKVKTVLASTCLLAAGVIGSPAAIAAPPSPNLHVVPGASVNRDLSQQHRASVAHRDDAGSCDFDVYVPAQFVIGGTNHWMHALGDCTGADNWVLEADLHDASGAYVTGSLGIVGGCSDVWYDDYNDACMEVDPNTSDEYYETDYAKLNVTTPGFYHTSLKSGFAEDGDGDFYDVYADPSHPLVAKYLTATTLGVTRSYNHRTFSITSQHYSTKYHEMVNSAATSVVIERQYGSNWTAIKTLTTNSVGKATYTAYVPNTATYRVVSPATATRWASYSGHHAA